MMSIGMIKSLIEMWKFRRYLKSGKPYFGPVMATRQGSSKRHGYMQALVKSECSSRDKKFYKILEVGSWAGGSAITWAEAVKKFNDGHGLVICVEPWVRYTKGIPGEPARTMDRALKTGRIIDLFLHNIRTSGHEDIVMLIKSKSDDILPLLRPNQFDLIFVDGNHAYKQCLKDFKNAASLVLDGGILCGDDLELQLSVVDVEKAKENSELDYILDPKTNKWFHPGVTLAVGELFGEVSVWEGFWAIRKRGQVWKEVIAEKLDQGDVKVPEHLR